MAIDQTQTYQKAKFVFTTLALKEDVYLDIPQKDLAKFRKHLSEMIKRQKSSNRYATRLTSQGIKVVRID